MKALEITLGPATVGHRAVLAGGRVVALVRDDRDLAAAAAEIADRGWCVSYRYTEGRRAPYLLTSE